jgi:hypothetical protein
MADQLDPVGGQADQVLEQKIPHVSVTDSQTYRHGRRCQMRICAIPRNVMSAPASALVADVAYLPNDLPLEMNSV